MARVGSTRRWWALAALALAVLATALDMTIINVALPTLARDLDASRSAQQWFTSAYTLTVAAVMLPIGSLGDRYGRRKVLLAALVVFGLASAWCAYSDSSTELIIARVALGLGGATIMPLSMAQMPILFPDTRQRDRAMGIWIGALTVGMPLGPLLGGWLLDHFWWGSVFLINVPLTIVALIAVIALVPESRSSTAHRFDPAGIVLSTLGLIGITYGSIRAGQLGWADPQVPATIVAGVAFLVVFIAWQRRTPHPLIDLSLFTDRGFRWGTLYSVLNAFAMFALVFTVPTYFQGVLGADAFGSGLRLLPMVAGMLAANGLAEPLKTRLGLRPVLLGGFGLSTIGMILGAFTTASSSYWYPAVWTAILGAGLGLVMITSTTLALGSLTAERSGIGSALITVLRNAGMTLGPAILGTIALNRYHAQLGAQDVPPIRDNVIAGVRAATHAHNHALLVHVQNAFMNGMSLLLAIAAGICLLSIGFVAITTRRMKQTSNKPQNEAQQRLTGDDINQAP
jgi:EmrB/QacA subfamily drug resistance transporter